MKETKFMIDGKEIFTRKIKKDDWSATVQIIILIMIFLLFIYGLWIATQ